MAGSYLGGSTLLHHLDPKWKTKKRKKKKKNARQITETEHERRSEGAKKAATTRLVSPKAEEKARKKMERSVWERGSGPKF